MQPMWYGCSHLQVCSLGYASVATRAQGTQREEGWRDCSRPQLSELFIRAHRPGSDWLLCEWRSVAQPGPLRTKQEQIVTLKREVFARRISVY